MLLYVLIHFNYHEVLSYDYEVKIYRSVDTLLSIRLNCNVFLNKLVLFGVKSILRNDENQSMLSIRRSSLLTLSAL